MRIRSKIGKQETTQKQKKKEKENEIKEYESVEKESTSKYRAENLKK